MSAEKRLTIYSFVQENPNENCDKMKDEVKKLIDIAVEGEGLENVRCKMEMFETFKTFVSCCLIHFTTSLNWRYNASNTCISDIFTESDEALCILLIENNAHDYSKMYHERRKIGRKEAKPRYTKVESVDKKFKGWDRRGIRRFNQIVAAVKKNRELSSSVEMELRLKQIYGELSGKGADGDGSESDEDCDELNELNGYDGLAGIPRDEIPTNDDMQGATNISIIQLIVPQELIIQL